MTNIAVESASASAAVGASTVVESIPSRRPAGSRIEDVAVTSSFVVEELLARSRRGQRDWSSRISPSRSSGRKRMPQPDPPTLAGQIRASRGRECCSDRRES